MPTAKYRGKELKEGEEIIVSISFSKDKIEKGTEDKNILEKIEETVEDMLPQTEPSDLPKPLPGGTTEYVDVSNFTTQEIEGPTPEVETPDLISTETSLPAHQSYVALPIHPSEEDSTNEFLPEELPPFTPEIVQTSDLPDLSKVTQNKSSLALMGCLGLLFLSFIALLGTAVVMLLQLL